jgi:flagellar basal-body rod modification protein FlgD
MQVSTVPSVPAGTTQPAATANPTAQDAATNAFGLSFDALLRIILTQLTYQDPLKPMDNFEFVSQLAQFSQLQIGQTGNDRLNQLVTAQANSQAVGLLGRTVDVPAGAAVISGKVTSISFVNGQPNLTIQTADNQTISGIAISSVTQIRQEN